MWIDLSGEQVMTASGDGTLVMRSAVAWGQGRVKLKDVECYFGRLRRYLEF